MKEMRRIAPEYCDCGHLRTFHLERIDHNHNPYCKCFGADTDWYYRTIGNMDFNEEDSFPELIEKDVKCKCTKVSI
jgi:hypothetical protein